MNVAAFVHYYVPFRNAGSETMLHTMLRALVGRGHKVRVYATDIHEAPSRYTYDGVEVFSTTASMACRMLREKKPDVIVTHHQRTNNAAVMSKQLGIPYVFLMHNDFSINKALLTARPDLVVFNTDWIRNSTKYSGESMVIHPPIYAENHRTEPGDRVTLVNLNEHKGGEIFYRLARELPHIPFLGVEGGHGAQILRHDVPNVEIVKHTSDMVGDVWSRTRTLLMPSKYESYGMAGVEAMASGIPVIANPTPGLKESLGPAGIFVDRDDLEAWKRELLRLQDPESYRMASTRATARSNELDPSQELNDWVTRIEELTR